MTIETIPVPGLTLAGWTTDLKQTIDLLLSHAFVSDKSHSTTCPNSITSFQALLSKYQNQPSQLADAAEILLDSYFKRYIQSAQVTVEESLDENYVPESGRFKLKITISAYRNGETINLAESLDVSGGRFDRIANINNDGE